MVGGQRDRATLVRSQRQPLHVIEQNRTHPRLPKRVLIPPTGVGSHACRNKKARPKKKKIEVIFWGVGSRRQQREAFATPAPFPSPSPKQWWCQQRRSGGGRNVEHVCTIPQSLFLEWRGFGGLLPFWLFCRESAKCKLYYRGEFDRNTTPALSAVHKTPSNSIVHYHW